MTHPENATVRLPAVTVGQVQLILLPAPGLRGGTAYALWPASVPLPPVLLARQSSLFPVLDWLEIRVLEPPADADVLILTVLLPDGRPHVCTPGTVPADAVAVGPIVGSAWAPVRGEPEPAA